MYGTHAITDEASGTRYALRSEEEGLLDGYTDRRVTVNGTLVPEYENGAIEGDPPLLDVAQVDPADSSGTVDPELGVDLMRTLPWTKPTLREKVGRSRVWDHPTFLFVKRPAFRAPRPARLLAPALLRSQAFAFRRARPETIRTPREPHPGTSFYSRFTVREAASSCTTLC
jgi:hypothetical protein